MHPSKLPAIELTQEEWLPFEDLLQRFEAAWSKGERPTLEDYLPAGDDCPWAALVEFVHTDLEYRLKAGEPARFEDYKRRFPALADDTAAAVELIETEYRLRRRREPDLKVDDYLARFPDYSAELRRLGETPGGDRGPRPVEAASGSRSRLGKYELQEIVGRGAFGIVYRARDCELDRMVAVKVPRPEGLGIADETDRFLREARSAAQLHHAHIATLLDMGQFGRTTYLVYEFVKGRTLAKCMRDGRWGPRRASRLVALLAEALEYAHRHGVIHRDLKPANIMIDEASQPHILDFGLAKREAGDQTLTLDGELLGTPAYMSPELARGEAHQVDVRTDIYSLGVVLYEILTGEVPFRGNARMMLQQVLEDEPCPLRRLNDQVSTDLETICLKCLQKEPRQRYASAGALADDLRRFLNGRPIRARAIGRTSKAWRWARRRPLAAGLLAALIMVTTIGMCGIAWKWRDSDRARRLAQTNFANAETQRLRAERYFRQAFQAVDEFARLAGNGVDDVVNPGTRQALLENAVKYFQNFVHESGDAAEPRVEMALAYEHLGDIDLQRSQFSKAAKAFRGALGLLATLAANDPGNQKYIQLQGTDFFKLGDVYLRADQTAESMQAFQQARTLMACLPRTGSGAESSYASPGNCAFVIGLLHYRAGQTEAALRAFEEGRNLLDRNAPDKPTIARINALGKNCFWIGKLRAERDSPAAALPFFREAVFAFQQLVCVDPANAHFRRDLAASYHSIGNLLRDSGDRDAASSAYLEAAALREGLVLEYPAQSEY